METRSKKRNIDSTTIKNVTTRETVQRSCKCRNTKNGLHNINCLPPHLRFNQYIHGGYRYGLTTWECLRSLFYFHNESFNVYSHGFATIALVLLSPYVYNKIDLLQFDPILYPIHHITSITCVLFSTIYHLMCCHEGGARTYTHFIMIDYFGVVLVTCLSCITFLRATFFCFPLLHRVVISIYLTLGALTFACVTKGTNSKTRLKPIMCLGVIRVLFIYPSRCIMATLGYTTGELGVVWYAFGIDIIGGLGGVVNLSRLPEKWYQGKFDYAFNSHNIMHIIVLFAPFVLHAGVVADFKWMMTAQCPS